MDDPSTDDRPQRRRRATSPAGQVPKLKMVSELPDDLPVTEAEIRLVVAMFGGDDGFRRKLMELGIIRRTPRR